MTEDPPESATDAVLAVLFIPLICALALFCVVGLAAAAWRMLA